MTPRPGEDALVDQLVEHVHGIRPEDVSADDLRIVRHLLLDTLAATLAGVDAQPVVASRALCLPTPDGSGATVLGGAGRASADQAAMVNGTAARVAEMNDVYVSKIGLGSHPSDMTLPILAAAEAAGASGIEVAIALLTAYEVYIEMADGIDVLGYDAATFAGMGVALASARLLGLDRDGLADALSIVTITHNPLVQTRRGRLTMWKAAAAGYAGSRGVHAAMLAKAGMEAPAQPFVGKDAWGELVARSPLTVTLAGGRGTPFRMHDVTVKPRAACQNTISSILAAEDAAAGVGIGRLDEIAAVRVETYQFAKNYTGTGAERWDPQTPETADHSIPYVVAAALLDGRVGPRSFKDDRLWHEGLRALLPKIEVVANDRFTAANEEWPQQHPTSVAVTLEDGSEVLGMTGFEKGDLTDPPSWDELVAKFHEVAAGRLSPEAADAVVDAVSRLEELDDVRDLMATALTVTSAG